MAKAHILPKEIVKVMNIDYIDPTLYRVNF